MDFLLNLDYSILHFINSEATHPYLDVFFLTLTDLHRTLAFKILFLLLGFGFYFWKFRKRGLYYFFVCLLSIGFGDWSASTFIKKQVERPRPFQKEGLEVIKRSSAHGYSFTSNHATNMASIAFYNSQYFPKAKFVFYSIAFLVGYSRVYNGVHFPTDVIVGALWGLLISFLFYELARRIEPHLFKDNPI